MANDIKIGDLFSSYQLLKDKLAAYEQEKKVKFYIRDGQTLTVAKKKTKRIQEDTNDDVKYFELKYCCIHGGMTFKKRKDSKGLRQKSTAKQGCMASIFLRLTKDGQHLEVTAMNTEHNHKVSEELYKHLTNKRKLDSTTESEATEMMAKKILVLVQNEIPKETGVLVTLQSGIPKEGGALVNLQNEIPKETGVSVTQKDSTTVQQVPFNSDDQLVVMKSLQAKYKATIRVAVDKDNYLRGLFIQDEEMRKCYNNYPEILFGHSICKLKDLNVPITLLMVEDSNGQCEVVAVGLLVVEDVDVLSWFLETFKEMNPGTDRTRVVTADKGLKERLVFNKHFPTAEPLICAVHALKIFMAEVTCEKFGITDGQRNLYIDIHRRMTNAKTEALYNALYEHFQMVATKEVLDYFNDSWHSIRREWTLSVQFTTGNFIENTNKRVEAFDNKIKAVVDTYSALDTFVDNLFSVLVRIRLERNGKEALRVHTIPPRARVVGSPEDAYFQYLTLYAYKHVAAELAAQVKVDPPSEDVDFLMFETAAGTWLANTTTCSCTLRESLRLPCRHLFAVRRLMELDLFDIALCSERWTKSYYFRKQVLSQNGTHAGAKITLMGGQNPPLSGGDKKLTFSKGGMKPSIFRGGIKPTLAVNIVKPKRIYSNIEKHGLVAMVTNGLASVLSEVSGVQFEQRIQFLQSITNAWKAGEEAVIQET